MTSNEIDETIRARLKELDATMFPYPAEADGTRRSNKDWDTFKAADTEMEAILTHHIPMVVDLDVWNQVVDWSVIVAAQAGGTINRAGNLYKRSDAEIIEAQDWIRSTPNWKEMVACQVTGDYPDWAYGVTVRVKDGEQEFGGTGREYDVPVSAYNYFDACFMA